MANISTPSAAYTDEAAYWRKCRDVVEGWRAVKYQGELYLPRLRAQDNADYTDYLARARFLGATGRTVDAMMGFLFRKDPVLKVPDSFAATGIEGNFDLTGQSIYDYSWQIAEEIMKVGRAGTLVDYSDELARPYAVAFRAEEILSWSIAIEPSGRRPLTRLVLREEIEEWDQSAQTNVASYNIRVYYLEADTGVLVCEVYRRGQADSPLALIEELRPTRNGEALSFIPFQFHGAANNLPEIGKPPIDELVELNLQHYMLSADLGRGTHFCGLPQAYVVAFDVPQGTELCIGSTKAWITENPSGRADYLEFSGASLAAIREAMNDVKREMASMGARMLEMQVGDEAWQTVAMRQSGETANLTKVSLNLTESMTRVLQLAAWWAGELDDLDMPDEEISITFTTDFVALPADPAKLAELFSLYLGGAISRQTLHERLQEAEVIDPAVSVEEELERIEADPSRALSFGRNGGKRNGQGRADSENLETNQEEEEVTAEQE